MTKLTQNIACVSPVAKDLQPEKNGTLQISRILRRWSNSICSFPHIGVPTVVLHHNEIDALG
jgi:hypothetical protein